MTVNKWQYENKLQAAVELFDMFPAMTLPPIARSLGVQFSWLYREFAKLGIKTRACRLGWVKIAPSFYQSPCGKYRAGLRSNGRWILLRNGRAIIVLTTFKACVDYVSGDKKKDLSYTLMTADSTRRFQKCQ